MKQPKPVRYIQAETKRAWIVLYRACEGDSDLYRWLRRAEEYALKGEREHRRMGARFTHGQARYRVPVLCAARSIVIHHVFGGMGGAGGNRRPASWSEVAGIREDCALAYAIREHLDPKTIALLETAAKIDYAEDIAA